MILKQQKLPQKISIHALVKRATQMLWFVLRIWYYFNPRPREEGDILKILSLIILLYFNPRPREEGDLVTLCKICSMWFQSTPSWRGRRRSSTTCPYRAIISIHALVKRATFIPFWMSPKEFISIHALVKRATNSIFVLYIINIISIHALVKRATRFDVQSANL